MKSISRFGLAALLPAMLFLFVMCAKNEEPKTAADTTATTMQPPPAGDRGTASATFGNANITINYGRPQLQGRDMLAQATDGMVWRMGMNEATEIKTDVDLKFGATVIPKGNYSLFMKKVSTDQWHLIFNKKTGMWGTEYSEQDDLAEVPLMMSTNPQSVEAFTVELEKINDTTGKIKASWGTSVLSTDFTVAM